MKRETENLRKSFQLETPTILEWTVRFKFSKCEFMQKESGFQIRCQATSVSKLIEAAESSSILSEKQVVP